MAKRDIKPRPARARAHQKKFSVAEQQSLVLQPAIIPVRMHTCVALYPFWLPSKNGYRDITIRFIAPDGKITTYWAVTFDARYGPPRELAYDIDSLIIARRFDQIGRPLPSLIPLGSMRSICRELGLQINGKNIQNIRQALAQNQWAQITADIQYTGIDGLAKRFKANFNRYSVIETGQQLPAGGAADCVYILLNELYLAMLNSARTRPLDYDYLRTLTHISRRFYEIVSFQIFVAIKYDRPEASIPYSRLCLFSAQTRSYDSGYVSAQMGKIHKKHLESGYISAVRAELVRDTEGDVDWIFHYRPGPRARREFDLFNKRKNESIAAGNRSPLDLGADMLIAGDAQPESPSPKAVVKQFHQKARGLTNHTPLRAELGKAQELLDRYGPTGALFIIDFVARAARDSNFKIKHFGGIWLFLAEAELAYEHQRNVTSRRVQESEQEAQTQAQELLSQEAYHNARARAAKRIELMNAEEHGALESEAKRLLNERAPSMKRNLDDEQFNQNVLNLMHSILARRMLKDEGVEY